MFANVIVENKSNYIDDFFTYGTGELEVKVGSKVKVPFGNREKDGYVFSLAENSDVPEDKIRDILSVDEADSLTEEMISTAVWMKSRYAIRYFDAIRLFTAPLGPRKRGTPKDPYADITSDYIKPEKLTKEQTAAAERLCEALNSGSESFFLIHGVTSSGKTEVYMKAIEECLAKGKGAIMLVPEISLTHQLLQRFIGRFGKDAVAVLHSRLTPRERSDEWMRIRKGEARIVIGARMGVFAPLEKIGCIILDEEHEATYKADMTPKYDTHEVAAKRIMAHKGALILGSATPSVTSYERAEEGIYQLIELKERYNKTPLPVMETVDMRKELRDGNRSIFSRKLMDCMEDAFDKGRQV
ncbi:MAG: primosomal protein N', partial [Firmicutes bacterium]|nr:primosomal protein N' [Bacillota bacterium]